QALPLPEPLRKYAARILEDGAPPVRRGTNPNAHLNRDAIVVRNVNILIKAGYKATRSSASRDAGSAESACSIVSDELKTINEEAVEKIWRASFHRHPKQRRKN